MRQTANEGLSSRHNTKGLVIDKTGNSRDIETQRHRSKATKVCYLKNMGVPSILRASRIYSYITNIWWGPHDFGHVGGPIL